MSSCFRAKRSFEVFFEFQYTESEHTENLSPLSALYTEEFEFTESMVQFPLLLSYSR